MKYGGSVIKFAHGGLIPHPQDIIKDSQSIVALSALTFQEKDKLTGFHQDPTHPNFSQANQWSVIVKKWKLQRSSYCRIIICFEGSLLQTFTWTHTTIHGHLFAMGCFRYALN